MAYFNSVTNDALMKERQQAFQREADRKRLVKITDEPQPQPKMNILAVLRTRITKVVRSQRPGIKKSYKA